MNINKNKLICKSSIFSKAIFPIISTLLLATQTGCNGPDKSWVKTLNRGPKRPGPNGGSRLGGNGGEGKNNITGPSFPQGHNTAPPIDQHYPPSQKSQITAEHTKSRDNKPSILENTLDTITHRVAPPKREVDLVSITPPLENSNLDKKLLYSTIEQFPPKKEGASQPSCDSGNGGAGPLSSEQTTPDSTSGSSRNPSPPLSPENSNLEQEGTSPTIQSCDSGNGGAGLLTPERTIPNLASGTFIHWLNSKQASNEVPYWSPTAKNWFKNISASNKISDSNADSDID